MKLEHRLATLEASSPKAPPVTLIVFEIFSASPDGPVSNGASVARVLRSPEEDPLSLERRRIESEPEFLERVAQVHEETHGYRPEETAQGTGDEIAEEH